MSSYTKSGRLDKRTKEYKREQELEAWRRDRVRRSNEQHSSLNRSNLIYFSVATLAYGAFIAVFFLPLNNTLHYIFIAILPIVTYFFCFKLFQNLNKRKKLSLEDDGKEFELKYYPTKELKDKYAPTPTSKLILYSILLLPFVPIVFIFVIIQTVRN